mmetsp:Transcript_37272/g.98608  ORF Transcript_37272/g.98608 Transcript_37272/m.98608 type:complete len:200 (-) Transcript_37272:634-1233(-)
MKGGREQCTISALVEPQGVHLRRARRCHQIVATLLPARWRTCPIGAMHNHLHWLLGCLLRPSRRGRSRLEHLVHFRQHLVHSRPLLGIDGQHPLDELDELRRVFGDRRELRAADDAKVGALDDALRVVLEGALEGRVIVCRCVQRRAQREDVRPLVNCSIARDVEEFWCAVWHRAVLRAILLQEERLCARGNRLARGRH